MTRSRFDNRKKKSSKLIWGIIIAVLVIAAGVASYFIFENKEQPFSDEQNADKQNKQDSEVSNEQQQGKMELKEEQKTDKLPEPEVDESGYAVLNEDMVEPTYIDGVLVANKKYPLPKDYNPGEDPTAVAAYEKMAAAASEAGYQLVAFSTFRSYEYQTTLYNNYVARDGQANADRYSARPGYSEHQTGLAFDIGEQSRQDLWLTEEFGETPAGQWLSNNAHKYGFILRYPKGKEDITGFMYESWHFRYLGNDVAEKVYNSGVTLEEYLDIE